MTKIKIKIITTTSVYNVNVKRTVVPKKVHLF
jgi:hypothetical protein